MKLQVDAAVGQIADRYDLTPRQRQVLRRVLLGQDDLQIADAMAIGRRTVKAHLEGIRVKTGLRGRGVRGLFTLLVEGVA